MRRSDREIKEFDDIVAVMKKCDVCRIALNPPAGDGAKREELQLHHGIRERCGSGAFGNTL